LADGWCWFVLREEYCWLVAGDCFVLREKYCWLVADKPNEQGDAPARLRRNQSHELFSAMASIPFFFLSTGHYGAGRLRAQTTFSSIHGKEKENGEREKVDDRVCTVQRTITS
jgi:hypothetical protein